MSSASPGEGKGVDLPAPRRRVVVAMSGGVDSSVAAALLVKAGHEVVGVTLRLWGGDAPGGTCCGAGEADRASRVAASLGIRHYVWDFADAFEERVIGPFCAGYAAGRTPNPCLACNGEVKFGLMLDRARSLGFDVLATGHYARVEYVEGAPGHEGEAPHQPPRAVLLRAKDPLKDQSYAVYTIPRERLGEVMFPLGELTKPDVRARARALGLASAQTPESQDICFVDRRGVGAFVGSYVGARQAGGVSGPVGDVEPGPGMIVTTDGRDVGRHDGIHRFTVGQRRGLGVADGRRMYVVDIDPETDTVVVGPREELLVEEVRLGETNWLSETPDGPVQAMTRYRGPLAEATLATQGQDAVVSFLGPVVRPSPGQAVVFYRGDVVVGGGLVQ